MTFGKLWVISYRDLLRNRRRSIFTFLAVALGLALLIVLNGYIAGVFDEALQNSIRLRTGHVQIRTQSYEEEKLSLQWSDLLDNPKALAAQASAMSEVKAATPVLWASGILNTSDESAGLQIFGVDPASTFYAPIREGMVAGQFLTADDNDGILMGRRLADSLGVGVGQKVNLAVVNAEGQPDQGNFTIRGLFSTGILGYDESAVFMSLAKAQAFTRTTGRASAVVILLGQSDNADKVAAALQSPGTDTLTWEDMHALFIQTIETSISFYYLIDGIVMLIVAVIIANTLLMAVFERIREMGILAALGMKRRQIMLMFLLEATILGLVGIAVGIVIGSAGVAYLATVGLYIGEMAAAAGTSIALGSTVHATFVPGTFAWLSMWTLVIILLASLYPAWFAARLEPVEALHTV